MGRHEVIPAALSTYCRMLNGLRIRVVETFNTLLKAVWLGEMTSRVSVAMTSLTWCGGFVVL